MSEFLETLKRGMQEAQQRFVAAQQKLATTQTEFQTVQQKFAAAQAEFQSASQEFQAFQTLVNLQTRKEQPAPAAPNGMPAAVSARIILPDVVAGNRNTPFIQQSPVAVSVARPVIETKSEGNKTQAVRDLLGQHPTGMTPAEIWQQLESQLSTRAYLYSVLKRLRDRGDAREKRGKYYLNPKPEESQPQTAVQ